MASRGSRKAPAGAVYRVGFAEYYKLGPQSEAASIERDRFFRIISDNAPSVVDDLRRTALPRYLEMPSELRREPRISNGEIVDGWAALVAEQDVRPRPTTKRLVEACAKWATEHHLVTTWAFDRALVALQRWATKGPDGLMLALPRGSGGLIPSAQGLFHFHYPGWLPLRRKRATYEASIREAFDEQLSLYMKGAEASAFEDGPLAAPPEMRGRHGEPPGRHLLWLVQWQVLRWSYPQIARAAGVGKITTGATRDRTSVTRNATMTIKHAIKACADLIELPVRRGAPGHPKNKQSGT